MDSSRLLRSGTLLLVVTACVTAASADFMGIEAEIVDESDGLVTWRVYAAIDNPEDYVTAVIGSDDHPLMFLAPYPLFNDGGLFAGLFQEDRAQAPFSGPRDTWLTIGAEEAVGNDTGFAPGFLDGDGVHSVVLGERWCDQDGGWGDHNVIGSPEYPVEGRVLLAQFTFAGDAGSTGFRLAANLFWRNSVSNDLKITPFSFITGDPLPFCDGDVDWDHTIGFADLVGVLSAWGGCECCEADVDHDGVVGHADLIAILSNWGPCE